MNNRVSGRSAPACRLSAGRTGWVLGAAVMVISLLFSPPSSAALNAFDPPKRLGWALLALCLALLPRRRQRKNSSARWPAWALMAWMTARTLLRQDPSVELEILFTWLLPLLMFQVAQGLTTGDGDMHALGLSLLAAGYVQGTLMLLQLSGLDPLFAATTETMAYAPGRMVGTIGYHNQAVDFLALCAVGTVWATPWFLGRLALIAPLFATSLLTGNRGGVLAFIAGGCAMLAWHGMKLMGKRSAKTVVGSGAARRKTGTLVAATLVAAALGIAVAGWSAPGLRERFTVPDGDGWRSPAIQSRLYMWRIAGDMIGERPVSGWGAGEYAFQYLDRLGGLLPERKTHRILQSVVYAREAHNDLLQFTAEFGAVGVALLIVLLATILGSVSGGGFGGERFAATLILSVMTVSCMFSFTWQTAMAGPLTGLLMGLLARKQTESVRNGHLLPVPSLAIVSLPAVAVVWFGWQAVLNQRVGNFVASAEACPASLERLVPQWAYSHQALLGAAGAARGEPGRALGRLETAARGFRDIRLWNNLGNVLARSGRWQEACAVYARWGATGIEHADALANLSVARERVGDFAGAAASLDSKIRLWPRPDPGEVRRLAYLLMRAGDYWQADHVIWRYERFWKDESPRTVAEMQNIAGAVALKSGNRVRAVELFRAALRTDATLESARRNLTAIQPASP